MKGAKVGFFAKMVGWINKSYPSKKEDVVARKSRFEGFLNHGKKEGKTGVVIAVNLCDEALDIVSDRIALIKRLEALEERMAEVECYAELTVEEADNLKDLLDSYATSAKESNEIKYQLTTFDKDLARMEHLGKDARQDLPEIKFAEERRRIFKQDIDHIEAEKIALEHEGERLKNAVDFIYKFSVAMIVFFGGLMLITVALHVFRDAQVMLTLAILLAVVIILSAMIYVLRRRLKHELHLNSKKQARAVELLSKKGAVYAHFTNYLNYEYKRFHVDDSEMLSENLTDYENYKNSIKRLGNLQDIMSQAEVAIDLFLKDKGIDIKFSSIENFAATLNLDDKKQFYEELYHDKGLVEMSLADLDARSSRIWDTLMDLHAIGSRDTDIIGQIIESYTEKAERILDMDRAEGTTAMDAMEEGQ
ncbi:MAG: hypothetical protein FWC76_00160 [Defluviitaleaceae bacterium]|nr:hypothetical protein [Defluviitaleaceae bacterium]